MKKYIIPMLILLLLLSFGGCGQTLTPNNTATSGSTPNESTPPISSISPNPDNSNNSISANTNDTGNRILIAYFSSFGNIDTDETASGNVGNGNTQRIAEMIQEQTQGDLFFIEVTEKYPANYDETIEAAMQQQRDDARPALNTHVENMDDYDVAFLGYPNWWGTLPPPVLTFLDEYDFSGKTIIPFCTHEGSGFGRSLEDLENALPDVTVLDGFSVRGGSADAAGDDVISWLSELNILA